MGFGMGWILNQILGWLVGAIVGCFDAVFPIFSSGLLLSPDVTVLPQVQALTTRMTGVVEAVFVLVFTTAGVLTMVSGGGERSRYAVKDLAPRLVVGFLGAHFSSLVCGKAIGLANGLTGAIGGSSVAGSGTGDAIAAYVHAARANPPSMLLFAVMATVIVVLLVTATFGFVARFCVLLVLTPAGALALACHALPALDPVARLWWRAYTGCLAVPVLQALVLQCGGWVLNDPAGTLPALGLPGGAGAVLNLLVVIVLLWTVVRVPGLVSRHAATPRPTQLPGQILRIVVIQRGLRALDTPRTSRTRTPRSPQTLASQVRGRR